MSKITNQLAFFELAFEYVKKNTNSELRNLEAEYSFGLISEKKHAKSRKHLESVYKEVENLLSTIQN